MAHLPPPNILRNTATLQAWRAYNRKANAPLILAMLPTIMLSSSLPVMISLTRHSHPWRLIALIIAAEAAVLAWLILAFLHVRAYKRTHPFVPPPPVTWSEKRTKA